MSYLEEFQKNITKNNLHDLMALWEEFCTNDSVDGKEFFNILTLIVESDFLEVFGKGIETAIPAWKTIQDDEESYCVFKRIMDIQQTNSETLAKLCYDILQKKYEGHRYFNEKIRLIGLRDKINFQGAISHFELLSHMDKGKFVFHTGGWGTGEIMEISLVREQLVLEFDLVAGKRELSFENAFKNLEILEDSHFLSKRFGNPDALEKEAKENPVKIVKELLNDLGPKTAAEIKDELCLLVIPEKEWTKWWQLARAKLKKDPMVDNPSSIKEPFILRDVVISHEDRLKKSLNASETTEEKINLIYSFLKNQSHINKKPDLKQDLTKELEHMIGESCLQNSLQSYFLLEDIHGKKFDSCDKFHELIKSLDENQIESLVNKIDIAAFKKRIFTSLRLLSHQWEKIFLSSLFNFKQNLIYDYLYKELYAQNDQIENLKEKLDGLTENPTVYPEAFIWYFQKVISEDAPLHSSLDQQRIFFEALFILLHYLEQDIQTNRALIKKIYLIISKERYLLVRNILKNASIDYLQEFLLLASKCTTFNDHDISIFHSLAEVANPALSKKEKQSSEEKVIWTTDEGYKKVKERIQHIATVETVENADEIKSARSHGDLRENAEYKFALEKRSRLQAELKRLSKQINLARILTREDLAKDSISVGMSVQIQSSSGKEQSYTLLGPWEADPEKNVLSYQSRFAKAMTGLKSGDSFTYQGEEYTIKQFAPIKSFA